MPIQIAVVIVAFNDVDLIRTTLSSLRGGSLLPGMILIIDNSTLTEVQCELENDARVVYRRTGENLGFCRANNLGIEIALNWGADYILLLNHDTAMEPDCLEKLVQRAVREKGRALVTPKNPAIPGKVPFMVCGRVFQPVHRGGEKLRPWSFGSRPI